MVGGKAGVTHFHVGSGRRGLQLLRRLLDEHEIAPQYVYPTHINRTDDLLAEGVALARRGCFVDMDTVDGDFPRWLGAYRDNHGPLDRLTVSSDAHTPGGSPAKLFAGFQDAARSGEFRLDELLPLFTANTAAALHLAEKGRLAEGSDADIVVLRRETLDLVHLIARGRLLVRDGTFLDSDEAQA
jgi:beta-aspartyl-dipeptidase (metallo-type)